MSHALAATLAPSADSPPIWGSVERKARGRLGCDVPSKFRCRAQLRAATRECCLRLTCRCAPAVPTHLARLLRRPRFTLTAFTSALSSARPADDAPCDVHSKFLRRTRLRAAMSERVGFGCTGVRQLCRLVPHVYSAARAPADCSPSALSCARAADNGTATFILSSGIARSCAQRRANVDYAWCAAARQLCRLVSHACRVARASR